MDPVSPEPAPPPRLRLAPGLRVVRRGRDHLQVGLYDDRRVLLPRSEAVEGVLAAILAGRAPTPGATTTRVVELLRRRGCVTTREEVLRRDRTRRRSRVAVLGAVPGVDALGQLAAAGVPATAATPADLPAGADVVLVLSTGELARERLDPLVRHGTSHVLVRLVDAAAVIGPFVVPGRTACLRCLDAHAGVRDPDHVVVTTRYARAGARARADGEPDVADPLLAALAVAWAARDVVAHLDGQRPSTWSRTLLLGPEPGRREEQDWSRHPGCGCSWVAHDPLSGTMGA